MSFQNRQKNFFNLASKDKYPFLKIIYWLLTRKQKKWPTWIENFFLPNLPVHLTPNQLAVTFINHATCLLQTNEMNFLTDPVWSDRVSPFRFIGPKRVRAPGIAFKDLPKIDTVLISHNHYHHLDIPTLKLLEDRDKPCFFVPLGDKKKLQKIGLKEVYELNWWQKIELPNNHEVIFVPAQHFSGRGFTDRNKSLWGSYVIIRNRCKIFFAGDTGYSNHFKTIVEKLGTMDVALLPIGAYKPRELMKFFHLDPNEAVKAHMDLQSKQSIAIHFGSFQLTDEGIDEPIIELNKALEENRIHLEMFRVLNEGETVIYSHLPPNPNHIDEGSNHLS